ncbi:MAG: hypothetical protein EOP52_10835 [Sphingobacteriales bacterium]|nr:MAG: hypothetical protein EOP52_10835 [Sphingobacteriales bacterium]
MALLTLLLLAIAQWLLGFALLSAFRIRIGGWIHVSVSVLLGLAVYSILPFFMELLKIPLTGGTIALAITLVTGLAIGLQGRQFIANLKEQGKSLRLLPKLYEVPFIAIIGFMIFVGAWRCFYYPPTPRDLTSGPEVIAEYTIKEKTMVNSVFTVDLESTNNQFKPPYLTTLQVIYKYAGFPFGQVWLITLVTAFIVFLYHALSLRLHKIVTGCLLIFFMAIPEVYAYTIMILFDYSNMVYLTVALFFLIRSFEYPEERGNLALAAVLGGVATYVRSETLVLIGFAGIFILLWNQLLHRKRPFVAAALTTTAFVLPALIAYLLSITLYINAYLPQGYSIDGKINSNLSDLSPFFNRFSDVNSELLFGDGAARLYGPILYVFLLFFIADLVLFRKIPASARPWLVAVLIVYIGLPFLGYVLPLMDLANTTKRGLFKLFPLLLFSLSYNQVLLRISGGLRKLEHS